MLPHAGGAYVYLREAYGRPWAFLWAWAEFWVVRSGAIAALAAAMTLNLEAALKLWDVELPGWSGGAIAVATIVLLAAVNVVGTRWGGAVQNVTTLLKAGFVALLAALPLAAVGRREAVVATWWPAACDGALLGGLGVALSSIMWAYEGWSHLPMVAEEVRDPGKNVPRALVWGSVALILLYVGANLAYHLTLTSREIAASKVPAAEAAERLLPGWGARLTLAMIAVSVFGALNASLLVGPRVLLAVGRDHRWLHPLRRVDPRFGTPALAEGVLAAWSVALVLLGSLSPDPRKRLFDVLTDYCIFGASLFYLAAVAAVFVLRIRRPEWPRPYRAWGYPLLPAVFVAGYIVLLAWMAWSAPWECASGLVLLGAGLGVYALAARATHRLAPQRRSR